MGLFITLALGVFVLAGAAIAGLAKNEERIRDLSVAIALGAMVMLLLVDLLPESFENVELIGKPLTIGAILLGVLVLIALDRFLPDEHEGVGTDGTEHESARHISIATALALVVHNIIEGMSVYGVAMESWTLAVLLGIGIGIHNVPMGMIVYAGIRNESLTHRGIVLAIASLSTFVGGLVMFALGDAVDERVVAFMISFTVGLLAYIVVFELVPHVVHSKDRVMCIAGVAVGLALVAASGLLETLA